MAVLPQIIPAHTDLLTSTLIFAVIDAVIAGTYFAILASLAALLLPYLRRPRVMRNAERFTGVSLIGLGLWATMEKA